MITSRILMDFVRTHRRRLGSGVLLTITLAGLFSLFQLRRLSILNSLLGFRETHKKDYEQPVFPMLTPYQVIQLGWAHKANSHPLSSYLNFLPEKRNHIVRIGIFGCSLIEGSEAAEGHDIASFLQREFLERGFRHVEVINFGVGSFGMAQSYLLWKYLGTRYGLDYVVFAPDKFHFHRDTSFVFRGDFYGPVHSRFIVAQNALKQIEVIGNTRMEATERYFSTFTPLRYLKFDNRLPLTFRALMPGDHSQSINPLYFRPGDTSNEALEIYSMIFNELALGVKELVILSERNELGPLSGRIEGRNVYFLQSSFQASSFLHLAPDIHYSALGNLMRAKELFALLTGKNVLNVRLPTILPYQGVTSKMGERSLASQSVPIRTPLTSARIELNGRVAGCFAKRPTCYDFASNPFISLLIVPDELLHLHPFYFPDKIHFVPILRSLKNLEPVYLSFETEGQLENIPIGQILALGPHFGQISLHSDKKAMGKNWILELRQSGIWFTSPAKPKTVRIKIGNIVILEGVRGHSTWDLGRRILFGRTVTSQFIPRIAPVLNMATGAGQFIEERHLKENGWLEVVVGNGSTEYRFPFLKYQTKQKAWLFTPHHRPLTLNLGGILSEKRVAGSG